jgi:hypothetical protein
MWKINKLPIYMLIISLLGLALAGCMGQKNNVVTPMPMDNGTVVEVKVPSELAKAKSFLSVSEAFHDQVKQAAITAYQDGLLDDEDRDNAIKALNRFEQVHNMALEYTKQWLEAVQEGREFEEEKALQSALAEVMTGSRNLSEFISKNSEIEVPPTFFQSVMSVYRLTQEVRSDG